jgi:transcriptional regulator with XRE-family HTH domain
MKHALRAADAGVPDLEAIEHMRNDMGRDLAARRRAARMKQQEFGGKAGYSRSGISNAETGWRDMSREFWEACDRVLGTGTHFADRYDRTYAGREPEPAPVRDRATELLTAAALRAPEFAEARAAYLRLGWPVSETAGGALALATGAAVDAFEVPSTAGTIAARWWLETGGREDMVRSLPALPSPGSHLAAIDAGDRWYFLVRSGSCPWPAPAADPASPVQDAPSATGPAVLWHAADSSVPVPPAAPGWRATWAFLPSRTILLPPPLAILHLLDRAVAVVRGRSALALPGGTLVTPATVRAD